MRTGRPRRWAAALALLVLPLLGTWTTSQPAAAAYHDGACTDASGVTVVVDHQELGGGVQVRCALDFPASGGTGLLALQLAGFTTTGSVKDGAGMVCRINNRPAADEDLVVGGQNYREACIATPPDTAFWGYWHAHAGGEWTFSQYGAARSVKPGGYEGWSFSLNHAVGSNPAPNFLPVALPEPTPTTTAPVEPPQVTTPAPAPTTTSAAPATPPAAPPTAAAPSTPAASSPATTATTPPPSPTPTASPSPTATESSPTPEPTPSTSSAVEQTPTPTAATSTPMATDTTDGGTTATTSGPGIGTFVGVGAVAGIAAAGGIVWWRRRNVV